MPSAYQEVEYLSSDGRQAIDTGWDPRHQKLSRVEYKLALNSTVHTSYVDSQDIGVNYDLFFDGRINGVTTWYPFAIDSGVELDLNWHEFIMYCTENQRVAEMDGNELARTGKAGYDNKWTFWLFAKRPVPSYVNNGKYKLAYWRAYDNSTVVRNFIPCYRKSDSIAGMYDLVDGTFYTNAGTVPFIVGPDVN